MTVAQQQSVAVFAQKHIKLQKLWKKLLAQNLGEVNFKCIKNPEPFFNVPTLFTTL